MNDKLSQSELVEFLISAKQKTYASGGSDSQAAVNPVIESSHQFEYRKGELLYRDIYFGESFFVGQETVYHKGYAIWSMCYAGGWTDKLIDPTEVNILGGFLQSALRHIPYDYPFRGPLEHFEGDHQYRNMPSGDVDRFRGVEHITRGSINVYELNYCGGSLY
jgi:hypothetical protein